RGKSESGDRIVATRSRANADRRSAQQTTQVIRITTRRQRRVQAADAVARRLVFIDRDQYDVAEELSFVDVDVVVDPTLAHRSVWNRGVVATKRRETADELVGGR